MRCSKKVSTLFILNLKFAFMKPDSKSDLVSGKSALIPMGWISKQTINFYVIGPGKNADVLPNVLYTSSPIHSRIP